MNYRTELDMEKASYNIEYNDNILMLGSCFTEHIGAQLQSLKYQALVNPLGICYHPIPLHRSILDALSGLEITKEGLRLNSDSIHTHWQVHSRLSSSDLNASLTSMNTGRKQIAQRIKSAEYLILSYGTAYYYEHHNDGIVANCHKFPNRDFDKKLASASTLKSNLSDAIQIIRKHNPTIKILLTVSPVRHIKDGIVENNRSKAQLISMVHEVCDCHNNVYYLPAYELLIDDLRNYRFYAEDMVHPSQIAINYIWKKISASILDSEELPIRSRISKVIAAANHRPTNKLSEQHQKFCKKYLAEINDIKGLYPHMNFTDETEKLTLN